MNPTAGGRGVGLSKERAGQIAEVVPYGGEEGDVEDIEQVGSEFEAEAFVEADVLREGPIEVEKVVHALGVAAAGAVVAEEGLDIFEVGRVGGGVNTASGGGGKGGAVAEGEGGAAGDTGGTGVVEGAGDVSVHVDVGETEASAAHDGEGDAGLVLVDGGEGPAAENATGKAFLFLVERKLPDVREDEAVGDVVGGRSPFGLIVELILGEAAIKRLGSRGLERGFCGTRFGGSGK